MQWIELGPTRSGHLPGPDFHLLSPAGNAISRAQFQPTYHLLLVFLPDPALPQAQPLIRDLAAAQAELAQARAKLVIAGSQAADSPLPLWRDPGGTARRAYTDLFPPESRPDADAPFLAILNRYSVVEYLGRDLFDSPNVASEAAARLWDLEYQCSL